jgi:hypothetical protein
MNTTHFTFRNKEYSCKIWVDISPEPPFYVFADLLDKELIQEFGDEITIKTDFETRLPRLDDYQALSELRQAVFNAIQTNPAFITRKNKVNTKSSYLLDFSGITRLLKKAPRPITQLR